LLNPSTSSLLPLSAPERGLGGEVKPSVTLWAISAARGAGGSARDSPRIASVDVTAEARGARTVRSLRVAAATHRPHQVALHQLVDLAVEHPAGVARLIAGPLVLDQP